MIRRKKELSSEILAFQNQIAFKHEKAEDYKRYMQIINKDFSVQYQDILKSEFPVTHFFKCICQRQRHAYCQQRKKRKISSDPWTSI